MNLSLTAKREKLRLSEIPKELCTADEAKRILGLRSYINRNKGRYKNLRYCYVVFADKQMILYNRKEVEALKMPAVPPRGYVDIKSAARILGIPEKKHAYALCVLKRYGVTGVIYNSKQNYRSHCIFKIADVKRVAKLRKQR